MLTANQWRYRRGEANRTGPVEAPSQGPRPSIAASSGGTNLVRPGGIQPARVVRPLTPQGVMEWLQS